MNVPDSILPVLCLPLGTNPAQFNLNTFNVIKTASNHPKAANFTVPSNLPAGNYYVYVLANATHAVYEYPGTPETRRSALPITIQRPDATVSTLTIPANAIGGQPITVNYSILNNGGFESSINLSKIEQDINSAGSVFAINRSGILSKIEALTKKYKSQIVFK